MCIRDSITNMIATRPDWCISRQRIWGVPIAVFLCENCQKPILDPALNRDVYKRQALYHTEGWPETYIIDRQGYIRRKIVGDPDWSNPEIRSFLKSM